MSAHSDRFSVKAAPWVLEILAMRPTLQVFALYNSLADAHCQAGVQRALPLRWEAHVCWLFQYKLLFGL